MAISISKGKRSTPDKLVLMGMDGVGKSTFAAGAPKPLFLCAEDGVDELDVARIEPSPSTLDEIYGTIGDLTDGEYGFETLVIDTVDWLEPVIVSGVCHRNGWLDSKGNPDIEKPGYGKGYVALADEWRRLLAALDLLREKQGMNIVLLAHTTIQRFANPVAEDYDRYVLKVDKRAAAIIREWVKFMGFATWEEYVSESDDRKGVRAKGVSTGVRIIKTQRTSAWDAKTRVPMPEEVSLDWGSYAGARDAGGASPEELRTEIGTVLADIPDEDYCGKVLQFIEDNNSAETLSQVLNRVREKVRESA